MASLARLTAAAIPHTTGLASCRATTCGTACGFVALRVDFAAGLLAGSLAAFVTAFFASFLTDFFAVVPAGFFVAFLAFFTTLPRLAAAFLAAPFLAARFFAAFLAVRAGGDLRAFFAFFFEAFFAAFATTNSFSTQRYQRLLSGRSVIASLPRACQTPRKPAVFAPDYRLRCRARRGRSFPI